MPAPELLGGAKSLGRLLQPITSFLKGFVATPTHSVSLLSLLDQLHYAPKETKITWSYAAIRFDRFVIRYQETEKTRTLGRFHFVRRLE